MMNWVFMPFIIALLEPNFSGQAIPKTSNFEVMVNLKIPFDPYPLGKKKDRDESRS